MGLPFTPGSAPLVGEGHQGLPEVCDVKVHVGKYVQQAIGRESYQGCGCFDYTGSFVGTNRRQR